MQQLASKALGPSPVSCPKHPSANLRAWGASVDTYLYKVKIRILLSLSARNQDFHVLFRYILEQRGIFEKCSFLYCLCTWVCFLKPEENRVWVYVSYEVHQNLYPLRPQGGANICPNQQGSQPHRGQGSQTVHCSIGRSKTQTDYSQNMARGTQWFQFSVGFFFADWNIWARYILHPPPPPHKH